MKILTKTSMATHLTISNPPSSATQAVFDFDAPARSADTKPLFSSAQKIVEDTPIANFGQIIHGSKAEKWQTYLKKLKALLPVSVDEFSLATSFPEPNYDAMVASGYSVNRIATIRAIRDSVAKKPPSWRLRGWQPATEALRALFIEACTEEGLGVSNSLVDMCKKNPLLAQRIKMYEHLGFPLLLKAKDWEITAHSGYSVWNGKDILPTTTITSAQFKGRKRMDIFSLLQDSEVAFTDTIQQLTEKLKTDALKPSAPSEIKFSVFHDKKTDSYFIGKKRKNPSRVIRIKEDFSTSREAFSYLLENNDEIISLWKTKTATIDPRGENNRKRTGNLHRSGDITPAMFEETFGFRGVQFGKWVKEKGRRQHDLNESFDAFLDMALILNIPPKALSLNGSLGLSFGARGGGVANAHYEPDYVVINLTKTRGHGSLVHEWFHAFDNYFAKLNISGVTDGAPLDQWATRFSSADNKEGFNPKIVEAFQAIAKAVASGDIHTRSLSADATREKPYWGLTVERTARAFEIYVRDRAASLGIINDFMVNITPEGRDLVYPSQADMDSRITQAFDVLLQTIICVDTPSGVMMKESPVKYTSNQHSANAYVKEKLAGKPESYQQIATSEITDVLNFLQQPKHPDEECIAGDWDCLGTYLKNRNTASSLYEKLVDRTSDAWKLDGTCIDSPQDVFALMQPLRSPYYETLKVIALDDDNRVLFIKIVSVGDLASCTADVDAILQPVLQMQESSDKKCSKFIVSHNHPSGDPTPSQEDIAVTDFLRACATNKGIKFDDHIITNGESFFSFKDGRITKTSHPPADWEVVPRSELAILNSPSTVEPLAMSLRNSADGQAHILYLSAKKQLLGVHRVSTTLFQDAQKLSESLTNGLRNEGALSVIIDFPAPETKPFADALKIAAITASQLDIPLEDFVGISEKNTFISSFDIGFLALCMAEAAKKRQDTLFQKEQTPERTLLCRDNHMQYTHSTTDGRTVG